MKYSGMITVKADGKEQNVYLEFEKDNVYDILRAYEAILNHAKGEEISVFARRWEA